MLPEPLLDGDAPWKQRFRVPTVTWTQLAAGAPDRGLACSNRSGTTQLHAWDVRTGDLRQLTDKPEGIMEGYISPDGRHVYYLLDQHGEETGHYVRVPWEGGEVEDVSPTLPPYSSWLFSMSRDARRLGFMTALPDGYGIECVELGPGGELSAPRRLFHDQRLAVGPIFSSDGELAVLATTTRSGKLQFEATVIEAETGEPLSELWDGPESSVIPVMFSKAAGDPRILATSDRTGVSRPLIWNPRTGAREDLATDDLACEVMALDWSDDAASILLCGIEQAVQHLYIYDVSGRALRRLDHPAGTFGMYGEGGAYFASRSELIAHWQDATRPPQVISLDAETGALVRTVLSAGEVPAGRPLRSVSFRSSDGQEIQAWLAVPEGDGPFPTVLETHGGPEAVATEGFWPRGQVWLDHGFAFLSVNYRGSTTFGREFKEKIWYHPGHWEVEDMAAGYRWLVEQGIATPEQVLVTGRSYGGYLTLQALGTTPDLWAGGMAAVAVADWFSQFEDESDAMRGVDIAFMGGTPEEEPDAYRAASPITYCDRVRAPVVVIQGRNDTRCPGRQVALYEQKMRALGKAIEVHWYDAGHFASGPEQQIEHQEIFLRFAYRVLRGRERAVSGDAITA